MKNMHFVLEGPDGVGKSTIAKMLRKIYNIPIISQKITTFKDIEIASRTFNTTIPQFAAVPFILDRWWVSSMVYAKVYKRNDDFSYIESLKKALPNSYLIYLTAPTKVLLSRKDDKLVTPKMLQKINAEYERCWVKNLYDDYFHNSVLVDTSEKINKSRLEELLHI